MCPLVMPPSLDRWHRAPRGLPPTGRPSRVSSLLLAHGSRERIGHCWVAARCRFCFQLGSISDLMNLDDVAVGIVEENLLPPVHRPGAIVGVGDPVLLEAPLECFEIVGSEGDVASLQRIYSLPSPERDTQILFRQMDLGMSVSDEPDLAGIPLGDDSRRLQGGLVLQAENCPVEVGHPGHIGRAEVYVVQL